MWVDKLLLVHERSLLEWLTFIPLVWPNCIPVLLLQQRETLSCCVNVRSVLVLRGRRWLDGASFDNERALPARKESQTWIRRIALFRVLCGEDLQWWPDKVFEKNLSLYFKWDSWHTHYCTPPAPKGFYAGFLYWPF